MKKTKTMAVAAIAAIYISLTATAEAMGAPPLQDAMPSSPPVFQIPPYKPVPTILEPELLDQYYGYDDGFSMPFMGTAKDPQDGIISGNRFKWTATPPRSRPIAFCTGSAWPGSGDPGVITMYKNCGHGVAQLPGVNGTWTITLCAADTQANIGCTSRFLDVDHPPT